jgi:hypothetical protein
MQLLKSAVIDTPVRRLIEMTFADQPNLDQASELLTFRVPVAPEGSPQLRQVQLEALHLVRKTIDGEIHRLEQIGNQDN